MDEPIAINQYKSLKLQIESDYENLKITFERLKNNKTNRKLIQELCRDYAFLCQDIKYFERYEQNISKIERPVSGRLLKDLDEIKILLREVKGFILF